MWDLTCDKEDVFPASVKRAVYRVDDDVTRGHVEENKTVSLLHTYTKLNF